MTVCRFCGNSDREDEYGLELIKYGVRHHAHPDCLLNAKGAQAFEILHQWQLEQFPALAAHRAGLLAVLRQKLGYRDGELANPLKLSDAMRYALARIERRGDSRGIAPITMAALNRRLLVLEDPKTGRLCISVEAYHALGRKHPNEDLCRGAPELPSKKWPGGAKSGKTA
jgi:hypothetical protein